MAHIVALNETDAEHTREFIGKAVKFIYQHSRINSMEEISINKFLCELIDGIEIDFDKAYE